MLLYDISLSNSYIKAVNLHVLLEVGAGGELSVAELAGVGLLPRVNALMPD